MLLKGIHFSHTNQEHFTRETNGSGISKANNHKFSQQPTQRWLSDTKAIVQFL